MSIQSLQMKYHPAKKEVEFKRFSDNVECPIRDDSKLKYYMNQKGKFVLQDHGNTFFDDIKKTIDGLPELEIKVITTKLDYEDFEQMVEYYNEGQKDFKITTTLLAELPDMSSTYLSVKEYGEEVSSLLSGKKNTLFEIPLENESVKERAESFVEQITTEINNIKDKILKLKDPNVNLCFAGVYSSGKSALINAILGYRVLPEAMKSETAKMFKISSPVNDEPVSIEFQIMNIMTKLIWNNTIETFEFAVGPTESQIRADIQEYLNNSKNTKIKRHEQLYGILKLINEKVEISSVITIRFPVSLDSESVRFTIFDTPGTDSNYSEHKDVLYEALSNQNQSILVFVTNGNRLEGEGNNVLLNYIKRAEEKDSKTTIDIGRSIFVMNCADMLPKLERQNMRYKEIKNKDDESFSIKLGDKKLLFTSALYGYAGKAKLNQIATSEDEQYVAASKVTISSNTFPMGFCYQQNRFATSELATKRMIEKCDRALANAKGKNDDAEILTITSGIYALEDEIKQYGEKFASAVKAFAIIDSVDRALSKMTNRAESLLEANKNDIGQIEKDISELDKAIKESIDKAYQEVEQKGALPDDVRKKLEIDAEAVNNYTNTIINEVNKKLKGWFFGLGKVHVKEEHKDTILQNVDSIVTDFNNSFSASSKESLEKRRDSFIESVKSAIQENSEITEEAKKYMLDVSGIDDVAFEDEKIDVRGLYNKYRKNNKFLVFDYEYLDKEGFINDLRKQLKKLLAELSDKYSNKYKEALNSIIEKISNNYKSRLDDYSLDMKTMIANKEAMMKLGKKLMDVANLVKNSQKKLNDIIWKEQDCD